MWSLFKHKSLLSVESRDFQVETYKWLLRSFGGNDFYQDTRLILPNSEFFPVKADDQEEVIRKTFELIKKYAGMSDWPCKLEPQENDPNLIVAPTLSVTMNEGNPLGTFSVNTEKKVLITYNPRIVSNPVQMVATFAHELSHYLTGTAALPPPGGWDNWEYVTDICATFLGFGIFSANSVFDFRQYTSFDSQGWQTSRSGYLSETEQSYSLAIFMNLLNIPYTSVARYCKTNIKSYLKQALRELEKSSIISELRQVQYEGAR